MAKRRILLVEDEKNIIELVRYNLEQEGYELQVARNGREGLDRIRREKPDMILLDIMLPEVDGIDLLKIIKQDERTAVIPVIMLTARGEDADQVLGLELGADDYVTKPFSPRQLAARVKAVFRRYDQKPKDRLLRAGAIELDTARYQVSVAGKPVDLTSKEFAILKLLMNSSGRVLTREQILDHAWSQHDALEVETRTVDKHVGELRKKLRDEGIRILTVKNIGYRFDEAD